MMYLIIGSVIGLVLGVVGRGLFITEVAEILPRMTYYLSWHVIGILFACSVYAVYSHLRQNSFARRSKKDC